MAGNRFWNFVVTFTAGTTAKAEEVNINLSGINTGLDDVASELDEAIQVNATPSSTNITLNAAARALKILTFNSSGDVVAVDDIGDWQGDHAGSTDYNERDIVKDAAGDIGLNNIYRANTSFTSNADMAVDAASWDLVIDVTGVVAAQVLAEDARDDAQTAEAGAEAQLILFTGQYYGSRTTAQESNLDPNNNASTTGDIYFNSTLNRMKVFNGATWQLTTANAVDVIVTDAGSYYGTKNVEFALQQNGAILQHITVTQAVNLDTMESGIATNASGITDIETKTDFITVTQAVNLDTIESDTTTNNAKVSNATHSGDVAGSTTLTIQNNAVSNAKAADMVQNSIKGRKNAAGSGDPQDMTGAEVLLAIGVTLSAAEINQLPVDITASESDITALQTDKIEAADYATSATGGTSKIRISGTDMFITIDGSSA